MPDPVLGHRPPTASRARCTSTPTASSMSSAQTAGVCPACGCCRRRCPPTRRAFRSAFRTRRCLVPADGFYEWQALPGRKQPFLFRRHDGGHFALAGLWEAWHGPEDWPVETCALLTTEANAVVRPVHDRMPVLLGVSDLDRWLSPDAAPADLLSLLRPAPDEALTALAVGPFVNSARREGPGCVEPLGGPSLFDRGPG